MWEKWTKLCEANIKHYNEHTAEHMAIVVVLAGVSLVALSYIARKVAEAHAYPLDYYED